MEPLPQQPRDVSAKPERAHALLRCGGHRFAVLIDEVQEVIADLEITPVPRAGAAWLGIGNLRGEIIPVASLDGWCGTGRPDGSIFLVLRSSAGKLALATDGVEQIASAPREAPEPPAPGDPAFISGYWPGPDASSTLFRLDSANLAETFRLRVDPH